MAVHSDDIAALMDTEAWRLIAARLDEEEKQLRNLLETCVPDRLGQIQGKLAGTRYASVLPQLEFDRLREAEKKNEVKA